MEGITVLIEQLHEEETVCNARIKQIRKEVAALRRVNPLVMKYVNGAGNPLSSMDSSNLPLPSQITCVVESTQPDAEPVQE